MRMNKQKLKALTLSFLVTSLGAAVLSAKAFATDVVGNINVPTRWTKAGSPYFLKGDVTIAAHTSLTIEPGVLIKAAMSDELAAGEDTAKVEFIVAGVLNAEGTAAEPIQFTSGATSVGAGQWIGLRFTNPTLASKLSNIKLVGAKTAFEVRDAAMVSINNVYIESSNEGLKWLSSKELSVQSLKAFSVDYPVFVSQSSSPRNVWIENAYIYHAARGIELEAGNQATIVKSFINDSGIGVYAKSGSSLISRNNIFFNNTTALSLTQAANQSFQIVNNTLHRDITPAGSTGIDLVRLTDPASFTIRNTSITGAGTAIRLSNTPYPEMDHNNLWGNNTNIAVPSGSPAAQLGSGSISANPLFSTSDLPSEWRSASGLQGLTGWSDRSVSVNNATSGYRVSGVWTGSMALFGRKILGSEFSYSIQVPGVTGYNYLMAYDVANDPAKSSPRLSISNTLADKSGVVRLNSGRVEFQYNMYNSSAPNNSISVSLSQVHIISDDRPTQAFKLQASSPLIDAGSAVLAGTDDYLGLGRSYDGNFDGTSAIDIGAIEWRENVAPLASAGPDRFARVGQSIQLDGSGSNDPDGGALSYAWDFGDGSKSTQISPSKSYNSAGTYTVKLTVKDPDGASNTDEAIITIGTNAPPLARIDRSFVQGVVGEQLRWSGAPSSDPDGQVTGYEWDFGDGTAKQNGEQTTHSYVQNGTYKVTLKVRDNENATASTQTTAYITVRPGNQPPLANIYAPSTGNLNTLIRFDGSASYDIDGNISKYEWDFGDGQKATGAQVDHAYTAAGNYLVSLKVTDNNSSIGEVIQRITIDPNAPANENPIVVLGQGYVANVNEDVQFDASNSFDPDGNIQSIAWNFGDGQNGAGAKVSHRYTSAGTYLVSVTITDDQGAISNAQTRVFVVNPNDTASNPVADAGGPYRVTLGQPVQLSGANSKADNSRSIAAWHWDFGDGSDAQGVTVSHTYLNEGAYAVVLTVTDSSGAKAQAVAAVRVDSPANQAPVADAGGPYAGKPGEEIHFDGSNSSDLDGTIVEWNWDFGDDVNASGEKVTHSYVKAGSYVAKLTVKDDAGDTSNATVSVEITIPGNKNPVAVIEGPENGEIGQSLSFDANSSEDEDGEIVSYAWDMGDGTKLSGADVSHSYAEAKGYIIKLTVTDDKGALGQVSYPIVITKAGDQPANVPPVAVIQLNKTEALVGEDLQLSGSNSKDPDGKIVGYRWELGDGTNGQGPELLHRYTKAGEFSIKLTVTDDQGVEDRAQVKVTITEPKALTPDSNTPSNTTVEASGCSNIGGSDVSLLALLSGMLMFLRRFFRTRKNIRGHQITFDSSLIRK